MKPNESPLECVRARPSMRAPRMPVRTLLVCGLIAVLSACSGSHDHAEDQHAGGDHHADGDHHASGGDHAGGHAHGGEAEPDFERGPNGGRMLRDGDFALEVSIFEDGIDPEFRVRAFASGEAVPPSEVSLAIELTRLGGVVHTHGFAAQGDFLRGDRIVDEPHSFDVKVEAVHAGRTHEWSYPSYEGRTTISPAIADTSGIEVAEVGPGTLRETLALYGTVQLEPRRVRTVSARFPGAVRTVLPQVGDQVRAGESLASIESNESLQVYAVTAPIGGTITQRLVNPGETAGSEPLFEIADLTQVRVELGVFPRDVGRLRAGQSVQISTADGDLATAATLSRVSPLASSRTSSAYALLDNRDGRWTPGQFVDAQVTIATREAPMVIPASAVQRDRNREVAYVAVGDIYEARILELGRNDGASIEVLSGLSAGDRIVVANSYLVKADIEKSGASHDH